MVDINSTPILKKIIDNSDKEQIIYLIKGLELNHVF